MDCSICLVEASDMTTPCNHSFHQECLDMWLDRHNTCPFCRCELEDKELEPDYETDEEEYNDDQEERWERFRAEEERELYYLTEEQREEELRLLIQNTTPLILWLEELEYQPYIEDSFESLEKYEECYEAIVYYKVLEEIV